jgi:hypothetical protein
VNAVCALLMLFVEEAKAVVEAEAVADAQLSACTCASSIREGTFSYIFHLHSLCMDAPEGAVRGGGLFL